MDGIHFDPTKWTRAEDTVETGFIDVGAEVLLRHNFSHVGFEVENTHGSVNLTDFQVLAKVHVDSDYHVLVTGAGWQNLGAILKWAVSTINTLAFGAKAAALIDVTGLYAIKFQAKTGSSGSVSILGVSTRNV